MVGGRGETRTPDPLLAKQVLCQLSYTPFEIRLWSKHESFMLQRLGVRRNSIPQTKIRLIVLQARRYS